MRGIGGNLQDRRKRVAELDLYQRTQERLEAWGKRRFWITAFLGTLALGTSGYTFVMTIATQTTQDALAAASSATKAAIKAEARAEGAAEVAATRAKAAWEKLNAVQQEVTKTTELTNNASEGLKQLEGDLQNSSGLVESLAIRAELATAGLEVVRRDIDAEVAGLRARMNALLPTTPDDAATVHSLVQTLIDESGSTENRRGAAIALAQFGKDAKQAVDVIRDLFTKTRLDSVTPGDPLHELVDALLQAIVKIDGGDSVAFLVDRIADQTLDLGQRRATYRAFRWLPPLTETDVSRMEQRTASLRPDLWFPIWEVVNARGDAAFANEKAKFAFSATKPANLGR